MTELKVTDFVKNPPAPAFFVRYRAGFLYYSVKHTTTLQDYEFPVEASDLQQATCECLEKPITLMRYIRKAIEEGTLVKI